MLKPPSTDQVYNYYENLLHDAQSHCYREGYVLKATCYQQNKNVNYKINFLCDQEGQPKALIKSNAQLQAEAEGQMTEETVEWLAEEV